jgi:UDP-N-acetylmuramate--alanine ligase
VAVFQPHLYSRTQLHGDAMGAALAAADLVVVTEVYAAREKAVPGVSGRSVADAARAAGSVAHFEADRQVLGQTVASHLRSGDVVLTLGAGDITRVGPELVGLLQQR